MPHQDPTIAKAFLDLLATLAAPAYSVGPAVPVQKRESAKRLYQMDADDEVLALVDSSLIGASQMATAKFGMAIGWYGIYWRNPFYEQSPKTRLTWAEMGARGPRFSALRQGVIALGDDARFVNSPNVDDAALIDLLRRAADFWRGKPLADRNVLRGGSHAAVPAAAASPEAQASAYSHAGQAALMKSGGFRASSDGARHDLMSQITAQPYQAALTAMLALWLHGRGDYSFDELDAIVSYLQHDDDIPDAMQATDRLIDRLRELNEARAKYPLKLGVLKQRMLADITGFDGGALKTGFVSLLDGLASMAKGQRTPDSDAAYIDIRKAITG